VLATTTSVDLKGVAFLCLDALVLAIVVLKPLTRNYDESDQGQGSRVIMRPPLRPSYARCGVFLAVSFVVSVFLIRLKSPNLTDAYHDVVSQLVLSVIPNPSVVDPYARSLPAVFQVSVIAFGIAFAIAFRASAARRFVILLNVLLFLVISAVADAIIGVVALVTGLPVGPTPVVSLLIQYLVAGIVLFRVSFTSFQLPKKTPFPLRRGHDWHADWILIVCVAAAVTVTAFTATFMIRKFGQNALLASAIVFACGPYLLAFITMFMGLVRLVHHRPVQPTDERPPIEVITPAFNEEICIVELLQSVDAAAKRYQGPVKVILCDDGSVDSTVELAQRAMADFQYATGEIINGGHMGKAAALNKALSHCESEFIYRVDADCIVHEDCFLYSVPYFLADPKIGLVGAFTLPKEPYATWIDRMRMFEMIIGFGFVRPSSDIVDGVGCVPGTFTAFRRGPALQIGGFVDGMYGEDVDFTYAITRLGYRVQIDTRVRSYEDVPNTQRQLRTQRTRWNRGGTMAYSRFIPIVTGFAGPRFWFFATRQAARRFLAPLHLTIFLYIIAEATFDPTTHVNLARVMFILLFRAIPPLALMIGWTLYYGKAKELVWLPLRYVFVLLKHYYCLECFLSFNPRPVLSGRMAEALRPLPRKEAAVELVDA
jgi:cellulose synthase/poly-beta-1,6-N-acetylglucosamine synthase-like glycosyltransferase